MLKFTDKVIASANVKLELTENDIENLIVSAVEGGCNYWGMCFTKSEMLDKPADEPVSTWVAKMLLDGKSVSVFNEDEEVNVLTLANLISGLEKHIAKNGSALNKDIWDAITADCTMQYALFGKIIYA